LPHNVDMGLNPRQQSKMIKETATELVDWIGHIAKQEIKTPGMFAKEVAWANTTLRERLKGRLSSYVVKSSHPERLFEKMDGFQEGGKMWKTFYESMHTGIQGALGKTVAGMDAMTKLGDKLVPKGGIQALYNLGTQNIGVKLGNVELTRLDKNSNVSSPSYLRA